MNHLISVQSNWNQFLSRCLHQLFEILSYANNYIEHKIQKGFMPKLPGTLEHTSLMAYIRNSVRQQSLVITLPHVKNALSEVHHGLIGEILRYHHIPTHIKTLIKNLYIDFRTSIITSEYQTSCLPVGGGVLQGDCPSPLVLNMFFLAHLLSFSKRKDFISLEILIIMIEVFRSVQFTGFNLLIMRHLLPGMKGKTSCF